MADCSKTEVFLAEWERFCRSRRYICSECPMSICCRHVYDMKNKGLAIIQKWSDEHTAPKPKTYADAFFDKFPNAPTMPDGLPKPYVCDVYTNHPECYGCTQEDSRKCWTLPYPEQEESK